MFSTAARALASRSLPRAPSILPPSRSMLTVSRLSPQVAELTLDKAPANTLSLEMALAFSAAVSEIEADPAVTALLLRSSSAKIFSAGLDIGEMSGPEPARLADFWRAIQGTYLSLYSSRLATVACIEGHAPAGGCLLSLMADYRIMTGGGPRIGLNETALGIAAPYWLKDMFVETVGRRNAELALLKGTLFTGEEALAVGLVDEVLPLEEVRPTLTHNPNNVQPEQCPT